MTKTLDIQTRPRQGLSTLTAWLLLAAIFAAVQLGSLFTPPLLDDADASHAQAAQHMAESGDWVTLKVDGIRYLEKPPLPYWIDSRPLPRLWRKRLRHPPAQFPRHSGNRLAGLALGRPRLGKARRILRRSRRSHLDRTVSVHALRHPRSAAFVLSAVCALQLHHRPRKPAGPFASTACGRRWRSRSSPRDSSLPLFFAAAAVPLLLLSGQWRRWRDLKPFTGLLLFLAIAAPWHILAGLANPDQGHPVGNHPTPGNVHGFWYFYFLNEHVFRFLGTRFPHDYNRMPVVVVLAGAPGLALSLEPLSARRRRGCLAHAVIPGSSTCTATPARPSISISTTPRAKTWPATSSSLKFRVRSVWLLGLYSAFILLFFSISTNQEYYTFPAWPTLLILIAGGACRHRRESRPRPDGAPAKTRGSTAWLTGAQAVFAVAGVLAAAALGWGLWESRNLPFVADIGTLLAHRDVGGYTLSMSHFFDLTGPSFAALRLPAAMAAITLLIGPAVSWLLRLKHKHLAATTTLALTCALFLVAAHIAFARFEPMLSSKQLADIIVQKGSPADSFIIYGDQSDASSVVFYTHNFLRKPAYLVFEPCSPHGAGSSLLWGSCYPDAPKIFLSEDQLSKEWGTGERKWLFAQDTNQPKVEQLLAGRLYPVKSIADKALWTDRPSELSCRPRHSRQSRDLGG